MRFEAQVAVRADERASASEGARKATRIAMMEMVTSISIRVNANRLLLRRGMMIGSFIVFRIADQAMVSENHLFI